MDDRAIGVALRTLRVRRGWRQVDLACRSGVRLHRVKAIEAGRLEAAGLAATRSLARALDADLALRLRWRGEELDRLLNRAHSALHEAFARDATTRPGWTAVPEVSFSIYGERGVIDVLLWHAEHRALAVVELKTSIVDVQELLGTLDRKRRLGGRVARERGWEPSVVGAWLVVADTRTNRRRVAAHAEVLRSALPRDGRTVRSWLRRPVGPLAALSFLPYGQRASRSNAYRGVRRAAPRHATHGSQRKASDARAAKARMDA